VNLYLLFLCLAVFAIGDILGVATKAKLSSVFVALLLFLVGFLTGFFPPDVIDKAGLSQIAKWASGFIIFHMGTMINLDELRREWKTVVMSLFAMLVAVVSIIAVIPLIGKDAAIVSIPIVNGGIIATQIMTEAAMQKGLTLAAALGAIVYAVQKFVGTPPASFFGLREAEIILREYRATGGAPAQSAAKADTPASPVRQSFLQRNDLDKYYTNFTCLAVTGLFAWLSMELQKKTGVNYSIWALLAGATVAQLGIVPERILDKGKASGLLNMAVFAAIIPSLAKIKVADLVTLSWQTIVIFAAVLVGTIIFMYLLPTWKFIGSRNLSVGIAMGQLLGFPATYLIANEIATAAAQNEGERAAILKKIMPAYVVAGLASVTTVSIVIAGFFVKFL
jgi:hypothetical protein